MTDIFISYASADRDRARLLADALARRGYSVWWDRTIPPGRVFDEVIQEAIQGSRCMIVLWSAESVRSNWVKTEAAEGAARGILVPALIAETAPPIAFKRIQSANLAQWDGDETHTEYRNLLGSLERLMKAPPRAGGEAVSAVQVHLPRSRQGVAIRCDQRVRAGRGGRAAGGGRRLAIRQSRQGTHCGTAGNGDHPGSCEHYIGRKGRDGGNPRRASAGRAATARPCESAVRRKWRSAAGGLV